jgi:hypothetical protein
MLVCVVAALPVLTSSCAAPYFERAAMEPGLAGGVGVGTGFGSFASLRDDMDDPYECAHVAAKATLYGRYNFTRKFGLFAQVTDGFAYQISGGYNAGFGTNPLLWKLIEMADIQLGPKFSLTETDAARVAIGTVYGIMPLLAEVAWLHDLNESWTTNIGLGTRGFTFGIGHHFPLADWATGHLSLTGAVVFVPQRLYYPQATGQFGLALEPRPRRAE